jgi:hypothetical protein
MNDDLVAKFNKSLDRLVRFAQLNSPGKFIAKEIAILSGRAWAMWPSEMGDAQADLHGDVYRYWNDLCVTCGEVPVSDERTRQCGLCSAEDESDARDFDEMTGG